MYPAHATYPRGMSSTHLPVEAVVPEVADALTTRGAAVLVAPPGSGKTTVVPLRLLDRVEGSILLLEPRRLATRAAARRMASLLSEPVGATVGYVTRHEREVGPGTRIQVVTEGILTRRLQSDPTLDGVGLVIFDEVHERNLQTDLGLALALDARAGLRPDLALLVMSATIDASAVANALGGAPVVTAEALTHPIDMRWRPPPPRSRHTDEHTARVIREALDSEEGDLLVFLPGMAEIRRVQDRLQGVLAEVLVLHGSLPTEEQDRAIAPSRPPFRKVVLSTDIAESSLTVEGVRIVIDAGQTRSPRFDPRTGMTRLRTVPISKASADQRTGRAGRTAPGVAYRLWSKMEQAARPAHIEPEITAVDLAGLALELAAWGVADPAKLTWLDEPPAPAWQEARSLLELLGALDGDALTPTGREMAALPLHPRLARMVVDAGEQRELAVLLAAVLDERDPMRGRPDQVPVDLALRVRLLADPGYRHPAAAGTSIPQIREVARDLARRAGFALSGSVDLDETGPVLALAYPDRLAMRRGGPGQFQLRTGNRAVVPAGDTLAGETFLVAADLDGRRSNARIRLAAGIDPADVGRLFGHEVDERRRLTWTNGRLVDRTERRLGGVVLDSVDRSPSQGDATTAALVRRVSDEGLTSLTWTKASSGLRDRVAHLRRRMGEEWPDWSDAALRSTVHEWLAPYLAAATGWDDVVSLDLSGVLRAMLGHRHVARLEELAPTHVTVPSGRRVALDYSGAEPTLAVRVQEMFGSDRTPTVGGEPVVLELLSPAERPVQVTSDLAGFWSGTWHDVRKEMAGRYPKHSWPEDPLAALPERK
jgi:ATP-dependent helicase HrpB